MADAKDQMIDVTSLRPCPEADGQISIMQANIPVKIGDKTLRVFSQQAIPKTSGKLTILLLHGQAFTSQNWVEINTLRLLASWGYNAVAVDLPGYGCSMDVSLGGITRGDFMKALVGTLPSLPVIISPSMSGAFSLPYLFSTTGESTKRAAAYVPVAPVMTERFTDAYPKSQLPTLIVFGSKDENLGFSSLNNFKVLPRSKIACIPGAGHACYMNEPALFHNVLNHFLSTLNP